MNPSSGFRSIKEGILTCELPMISLSVLIRFNAWFLLVLVFIGLSPAIAQDNCKLPQNLRSLSYSEAISVLGAECPSCSMACKALDTLAKWTVCQEENRKCPEVDSDIKSYDKKERRLILGQMSQIRKAARTARKIVEKEKLDKIDAESTPPPLNRHVVNRSLHAAYAGSSTLSNGTMATILRIDPNTFSHCDEEYCYAMAGIVKSRMYLDSEPNCSLKSARAAYCEFDLRLNVESTLNDSNDFRNQFLNALTTLERLSGRGDLEYTRGRWQFINMSVNQ